MSDLEGTYRPKAQWKMANQKRSKTTYTPSGLYENPCYGCVNSIAAGKSDGGCMSHTGEGERCVRCDKGRQHLLGSPGKSLALHWMIADVNGSKSRPCECRYGLEGSDEHLRHRWLCQTPCAPPLQKGDRGIHWRPNNYLPRYRAAKFSTTGPVQYTKVDSHTTMGYGTVPV